MEGKINPFCKYYVGDTKSKGDDFMSKRRLVVPEARNAFEQFKTEIANEYGVDDPAHLASKHTGVIVRDLIAKAERQLINKK